MLSSYSSPPLHQSKYFLWSFFVVTVALNFAVVFPFAVLVYRLDFSRKIDFRVCGNTLPMSTHSGLVYLALVVVVHQRDILVIISR